MQCKRCNVHGIIFSKVYRKISRNPPKCKKYRPYLQGQKVNLSMSSALEQSIILQFCFWNILSKVNVTGCKKPAILPQWVAGKIATYVEQTLSDSGFKTRVILFGDKEHAYCLLVSEIVLLFATQCLCIRGGEAMPGQTVSLVWYSSDVTMTSLMMPPSFNTALHVTQKLRVTWSIPTNCELWPHPTVRKLSDMYFRANPNHCIVYTGLTHWCMWMDDTIVNDGFPSYSRLASTQ